MKIARRVVSHYTLACSLHAILHYVQFLLRIIRNQARELVQISVARQKHSMRHGRTGRVQLSHPEGLHGVQVQHLGAPVHGAAPRRARKQLDIPRQRLGVLTEPESWVERPGVALETGQEVGAVAVNPDDAIVGAVDGRVVLGAGEGGAVDLDADDLIPVAREGEGNGVAASAREEVDYDARGVGEEGVLGGELGGDFAEVVLA